MDKYSQVMNDFYTDTSPIINLYITTKHPCSIICRTGAIVYAGDISLFLHYVLEFTPRVLILVCINRTLWNI